MCQWAREYLYKQRTALPATSRNRVSTAHSAFAALHALNATRIKKNKK